MVEVKPHAPVYRSSGLNGAWICRCGMYRYALHRGAGRLLPVIMLNPSKADAFEDDPTIRRLCGFSERWGFEGIYVVNLFAFRTPHPSELAKAEDPVGPHNGWMLEGTIEDGAIDKSGVLVAWGSSKLAVEQAQRVLDLARKHNAVLWCLARTKDGSPIHPMARGQHRVPDWAEPQVFQGRLTGKPPSC